jgi:predicted ATP-binding protein involved in virulence
MKIKELHLTNFRGFDQLDIEFKNRLAVFIGVNGAGKSAILDAIGALFSYVITKSLRQAFSTSKKADIQFNHEDIQLGKDKCKAEIKTNYDNNHHQSQWALEFPTNKKIEEENELFRFLSKKLKSPDEAIPVFAFYQSERIVSKLWDRGGYLAQSSQSSVYRNIFRTNFFYFDDFLKWFELEESFEDKIRLAGDFEYRNPKLEIVREALNLFLSKVSDASFSNLRVRRDRQAFLDTISSSLTITKNGKDLNISQLSTGEKTTILLVVDIAMRLAIANSGDKSLYGEGIVLIDEIDLHLHPQWQREVIPALLATFPNLQFIVTTHSPQVLSKVKKESIFILEDGKLLENVPYTYGRNASAILFEIFGVTDRPADIQDKINLCSQLLEEENYDKAKVLLKELTELLGENDEAVIGARTQLLFDNQMAD